VLFAKALGLQTAIGQISNRMNICKGRSNVVLEKYDRHLMMCSRAKGHDAAAKKISEVQPNKHHSRHGTRRFKGEQPQA